MIKVDEKDLIKLIKYYEDMSKTVKDPILKERFKSYVNAFIFILKNGKK